MGAAAEQQGAGLRPVLYRVAQITLVVVGALPWIAPLVTPRWTLPGSVIWALDNGFDAVCHRIPERALPLAGTLMPICSRCAGIFAGLAIGAVIARPHLTLARTLVLIGIASALMVLDVVTQDLGIHPIWHPTRIATGIAVGYVLAVGLLSTLRR